MTGYLFEQGTASPKRDEVQEAGRQMVEIQRQYPGLWVAVKDGSVVEARENPYALYLLLRERGQTSDVGTGDGGGLCGRERI